MDKYYGKYRGAVLNNIDPLQQGRILEQGPHEALIGIGYTVGPLCGVFSCALVRAGWIAPEQREGALLLAVAALSLTAGSWAWTSRGRA